MLDVKFVQVADVMVFKKILDGMTDTACVCGCVFRFDFGRARCAQSPRCPACGRPAWCER